jgi:hypothetical protein
MVSQTSVVVSPSKEDLCPSDTKDSNWMRETPSFGKGNELVVRVDVTVTVGGGSSWTPAGFKFSSESSILVVVVVVG